MESHEHTLLLEDGRTLAYHTFEMPKSGKETNPKELHPVLYFHGFPGCGIEAGISCARAVGMARGRVYAIDRPGMGKISSPYNNNNDNNNKTTDSNDDDSQKSNADINLETFIDNIWELVQNQEWKEFSVIGVSGGGPYVLALLSSYLRKKSDNLSVARLLHVSLVGAVIFSAGSVGMKDELVQMNQFVEKARTSNWYRFLLAATVASMSPVYNYVLPYIPLSWTKSLASYGNKTSPPVDREWVSKDENLIPVLNMMGSMAAQGGYPGIYDDAMILMRTHQPHEKYLSEVFEGTHDDLPAIGIFQGLVDANVPPSHAKYLHERIFHKQSQIFHYEGLGHESLIMGNPDDYTAFAATGKKK